MKTLYLMRHGQTLFNLQHKIQGWCDAPLTEIGIKQAEVAGKWFDDNHIQIDDAYCSTSERASDTLEIVTHHNMPYTRLKGLKEMNFGVFDYTFFAHIFLTCFKLRFNKSHHRPVLCQNCFGCRQNFVEGNKSHIYRRQINFVRQRVTGQIAHIGSLHIHNPRVLP